MVRSLILGFLLAQFATGSPHASAQDAATPASEAFRPAPDSFAAAQALAAKGRVDQALVVLDKLRAENPEPAGVERLRGNIFYQKQQLPEAIEAFTRAAQQDPSDSESIEMHGVILFTQGHPDRAIPFLEKAHAAVESANVDPAYVLGLCYADVK